jgi:hypothetical protein
MFSVLRSIFLLCRTRQLRLTTKQMGVMRHLQPRDLPAAAHKGCTNFPVIRYLTLFIFCIAVIGKNLKRLLVALMLLYLCLLPLFEATTLAVDVAIAFAGSSCTLGFRYVKNLPTV